MHDHYLRYLERELARLDGEIQAEHSRPLPRRFLIARLHKLQQAVREQISAWTADAGERQAA